MSELLEGEPERIHLLVTTPAILLAGRLLDSFSELLMIVLRNHGLDVNRYVWNRTTEQMGANPFAALHGMVVKIPTPRRQPRRMSQNPGALTCGHPNGLRVRPNPISGQAVDRGILGIGPYRIVSIARLGKTRLKSDLLVIINIYKIVIGR